MAQYYNSYPATPDRSAPGPPPKPQLCGDGWTGCCIAISGIAQIMLGILSICFGAVMLSQGFLGLVYQIYIPLWGGMMFFIAGILGVMVVCCRKGQVNGDDFCEKCLILGYIVLSLIAVLIAIGQIAWEGLASTLFDQSLNFFCENNFLGTVDNTFNILGLSCSDFKLVYYMHIAASVIAAIEIVAALTACCFGCYLSCCSSPNPAGNPMIVQNDVYPYGMNPYASDTQQQLPSQYGQYGHYAENPTPMTYYNGYSRSPQVHYNGQNAMFVPQGYM